MYRLDETALGALVSKQDHLWHGYSGRQGARKPQMFCMSLAGNKAPGGLSKLPERSPLPFP